MNKIITLTILISTMGLFSFFNKPKKENLNSNSAILGMVLLEDENSLEIEKVVHDLEENWKLKIDSKELSEEASVLNIDDYNIAIGVIPAPIPGGEVEAVAKFNYLWPNGEEEAGSHKGHIILSILNAGKDPIKENILFNQVAASVLENSKSLGIYIGQRSLLLKKDFYLESTASMSKGDLPLYNWVYFGLISDNGKQSVYTYGLLDFGKKEMEIIESKNGIEELSELMYNLTYYVVGNDVELKSGETIGMSAEQKLKISESKGIFLDGKTLKVDF